MPYRREVRSNNEQVKMVSKIIDRTNGYYILALYCCGNYNCRNMYIGPNATRQKGI